jgi:D-alanyl-D-alanine carboxypeptidase
MRTILSGCRRWWIGALPLSALLFAACASPVRGGPAASEAPAVRAVTAARLDAAGLTAALEAARGADRLPGVAATVLFADGHTVSAAVGAADVEAGRALRVDDRMPAGSVGKAIVAATAIKVFHDRGLSLDRPISACLSDRPWFARLARGDRITMRQLLSHDAGVRDHVGMPDMMQAAQARFATDPDSYLSAEESIGFILDKPPVAEPGETWAYSDAGYLLAGLCLEQITAEPFYRTARAAVLEPLGLTSIQPQDRRDLPGLAVGYPSPETSPGLPPRTLDAQGRFIWNPSAEFTGGGFAAATPDLARLAARLWSGRAFNFPYLDAMLATHPTGLKSPELSAYGLGVFTGSSPLGPRRSHTGWYPGYTSAVAYYPERCLAIAVQVNTDAERAAPAVLQERLEPLIAALVSKGAVDARC